MFSKFKALNVKSMMVINAVEYSKYKIQHTLHNKINIHRRLLRFPWRNG